jgi:hypothetical protein
MILAISGVILPKLESDALDSMVSPWVGRKEKKLGHLNYRHTAAELECKFPLLLEIQLNSRQWGASVPIDQGFG